MTPLILSMVAALASPFSFGHGRTAGEIQTTISRVQGWRIEMRRDRFLDTSSCRLRRGPMTLDRGVMVFHFPRAVDTAAADFRIDGGAAQSVGAVGVEVAGHGVALTGDNLRYPGDGRVAIPVRLLRSAQVVAIRPNAGRRHRTFDLTGLNAALEASQRQGCAPSPDAAATS